MTNVFKFFVFIWCSVFAILLGFLGSILFVIGFIGCLIFIGYPIMKLGALMIEQTENVFYFGFKYAEDALGF